MNIALYCCTIVILYCHPLLHGITEGTKRLNRSLPSNFFHIHDNITVLHMVYGLGRGGGAYMRIILYVASGLLVACNQNIISSLGGSGLAGSAFVIMWLKSKPDPAWSTAT